VTGGEEDGVNNEGVDASRLYTQPDEVWQVYKALSAVLPPRPPRFGVITCDACLPERALR
jgi:hypothetical protein